MRKISWSSPVRRVTVAVLGLTAIAATTFAFPGAAQAASDHSISGETWSSASEWYRSATVRTKAGTGNVNVTSSTTPRWFNSSGQVSSYDTMKWQLINSSGGVISGSYKTGITRNSTKTLTSLTNGTQFRNEFARGTTCFNNCSHTFSGTQYY